MTTSNEITGKLENQAPHLDYYPHWLDNLADDVILQGAVFNGELRGAERVGKMLSFARSLYAFQDFRFYGMRGDIFLEDYRSRIRGTEAYHPSGVEIYNFVVVYFNDAGETSQLVMNHRPQSAALLFSSLLREHFGDDFEPNLFYEGDVGAHLLDRDLSRGLRPPSSRRPEPQRDPRTWVVRDDSEREAIGAERLAPKTRRGGSIGASAGNVPR